MLIDKLQAKFAQGTTLTPVRQWTIGGHEVGVYRVDDAGDSKEDPGSSGIMLACDCDTDVTNNDADYDPDNCPARIAARAEATREAQAALAPILAASGIKAAILEIHRRVQAKEYLGQSRAAMIYVDEVATLLGADPKAVWSACDELFAEEKLELTGAILIDWGRRFRIPLEMADALKYAVEEPLGWPNGDAGMIHLYEFEAKVQMATGLASGKHAFGVNFPHADPALLADFFVWLAREMSDAARDAQARDALKTAGADRYVTYAFTLKAAHPTVLRADVLALCAEEFVRVALERIEIDAAMRQGITPGVTLGEMAEFFAGQAKHFRELSQKPQG